MTGGMEFWLAVHSSNPRLATSALGQKQTFEWIRAIRFTPKSGHSALRQILLFDGHRTGSAFFGGRCR